MKFDSTLILSSLNPYAGSIDNRQDSKVKPNIVDPGKNWKLILKKKKM